MSKNKRNSLTILEKLSLLKEVEKGSEIKTLCIKYNVKKSTLSRLIKNKKKFELYAASTYEIRKTQSRMKNSKLPELERLLHLWFLKQPTLKNIITNNILQLEAKRIYKEMGCNEEFSASDGWLNNFKKRHGIRILTISGEKLSCDSSQIPVFIEKFKNIVQENNYLPDQIYNCYETGLVYKGLPTKTNVHKQERLASGRKCSKERVTIMPCVNATGNHKLPMMMIGKAAHPRCFESSTIPLYYRSSTNAWLTTHLFKAWFTEQFIPEVTSYLKSKDLPIKALLLLDNATCHETELSMPETKDFKIMYLPPNMTPYLQPLDQNVIKSLKMCYRKHLLVTLASRNDDIFAALNSIDLKDVAYMIVHAWNQVSQGVIVSSFKHLYPSSEKIGLNPEINHSNTEDNNPIAKLYNSFVKNERIVSDSEIISWASGGNEHSQGYDLNAFICDNDENETENDLDQIDNSQEILKIAKVFDSFNMIIEWAENDNLPVQDILLLRRIREKAVIRKFE